MFGPRGKRWLNLHIGFPIFDNLYLSWQEASEDGDTDSIKINGLSPADCDHRLLGPAAMDAIRVILSLSMIHNVSDHCR